MMSTTKIFKKANYLVVAILIALVVYVGITQVKAQTPIDEPAPTTEPTPTDSPENIEPSGTPSYFLKIDGIEGESTNEKHKNEIDILKFSWGETNTAGNAGGGGGGAGKVQMQDFHFVMKYNKASPKIMLACANGKHIPKAELTLAKAGGEQQEYLKWTLTDVVCTKYNTSGINPNIPTDTFNLNFARIQVEYKPQKPDGSLDTSVKAGWDVKQNKSL